MLLVLAWAGARLLHAYLYIALDARAEPSQLTRLVAYEGVAA